MNLGSKVLMLAAALSGLAAAADRDMMNLVMPDASLVVEVNFAKIMASPMGSAMGDAVKQGIAAQLHSAMAKPQPQIQAQIVAAMGQIDWSRDVQDILVAGGTTKPSPMLMIVRSSLDAAHVQALQAFTGSATEYEGVPLLVSSKPGNGVVAFLDNSILLIGQLADVQAAIRRRSKPAALSPALAAQVAKYGGYDIWVAFTGTISMPSGSSVESTPGAKAASDALAKVAAFNGGVRLSPDFELSADIQARTEKDAGEMASGLRWLSAAAQQAQARNAAQGRTGLANGLESLKCQVAGRRVQLSLHVPEEQVRAGIEQMRTQMRASQVSQSEAAARRAVAPPPGTIRVESSEGTVLIQTDKDQ